jgi:hypothetical protein
LGLNNALISLERAYHSGGTLSSQGFRTAPSTAIACFDRCLHPIERPSSMRRPTLPFIATTAAIGAMAIAVPALASSDSSPAAHAAARHCSAVIVISHGKRIRACLIQGPRGFTGSTGATGAPGKTGATGVPGAIGKTGLTGKEGKEGREGPEGFEGAPGTTVAYAIVQPTNSPPTANLINPSNIASVTEPSPGIYCITPTTGVPLAGNVATVSPEVSYGTIAAPGVIAVNAQHTHCSTPYEVDTYAPGATPTLATGYAFTIAIP